MIRHLAEVWLLLAATFLVGSLLGALLYRGLALGPLAAAQGALADAIGDAVGLDQDGVGTRIRVAPLCAAGCEAARERPGDPPRPAAAEEARAGGAAEARS